MTDLLPPCSLLVVAGGSGERFGGPKQFADLAGWPLLAYCLGAFDAQPDFVDRIVVLPAGGTDHPAWRRMVDFLHQPVRVVDGGATRALSVRAGLAALTPGVEVVAVHDGARPFPPLAALGDARRLLAAKASLAGVTVARGATDTLKRVTPDHRIETTIDRGRVACAETPQVCRVALLARALDSAGAHLATDETGALEMAGHQTAVVLHDGHNPKITHPGDLALASAWLGTEAGFPYRLPR